MISQTGLKKKKINLPSRAFTLIELLIVSAIILTLISFSMPLFRKAFTGLELKEAASNISNVVALAQEKAIVDRSIYKISFDFEANTYQLFRLEGEGQNIKYNKIEGRFGRVFYIPKNIEISGRSRDILFYPDGHSDDGYSNQIELDLTSKANKNTLTITITGSLGNAIIAEKKE